MPYFSENYGAVRYPIGTDTVGGLRKAQIGALHAISSHFTIRTDSALVSLPTGAGKTLVLTLVPYILRANRALVVTPSRLVRNQIAEEIAVMKTARIVGALAQDVASPRCHELLHRVEDQQGWEVLRHFDVVVATPNGVSPFLEPIPPPPADLFDLLLIDEAHHAPADTWSRLMDSFPTAAKALFTATPYRRDYKEIKGTFVYSYPLRQAYEDKIFGRVQFVPVQPERGESNDVAIARAANRLFTEDRAAGLQHALMVRTDRKRRADELKELYAQHTNLRLQVVHSGLTYKTIQHAIQRLREQNLDGIICVDMMSEGFDFPQLKIAAIHIPHKSLETTLQFIGRFARTNAERIGDAKFVAVPEEIKTETQRLYRENAVWEELIVDLTERRQTEEANVRATLGRFAPPIHTDVNTEDLSLYALWPYFHVKIYQLAEAIDMPELVDLPAPFRIAFQQNAPELSAIVVIGNEQQRPRWTDLDLFNRSEYELFVIYLNPETNLLFICASRRSDALYEAIGDQFGPHKILPLWKINRVLRGLSDAVFFSLGMKNRLHTSNTESYRNIAGPRAHLAVAKSDGRIFHRGHVYGKGKSGGEDITIGYSSASKVWSQRNGQIPHLIAWCRAAAVNLGSDAPVPAHEGISFLSVGEELRAFPPNLIAAEWDTAIYRKTPALVYATEDQNREVLLTDVALNVDALESTPDRVRLSVRTDDFNCAIDYSLTGDQFFEASDDTARSAAIQDGPESLTLLQYVNNYPPTLYSADFTSLRGAEIFRTDASTFQPFNIARLHPWDWTGVNIGREFWNDAQPHAHLSIHEHLLQSLDTPDATVILYDHRTGEVADIIVVGQRNGKTGFAFYHVKGSSEPNPGQRVGDVYEVCGQIIKSVIYINNPEALAQKLHRRLDGGSRCTKGSEQVLDQLFADGHRNGFTYELVLVQPGLSPDLAQPVANILAAADDFVRRSGADRLSVITSRPVVAAAGTQLE
jgi:superfamily II DNA or RNA helicase